MTESFEIDGWIRGDIREEDQVVTQRLGEHAHYSLSLLFPRSSPSKISYILEYLWFAVSVAWWLDCCSPLDRA